MQNMYSMCNRSSNGYRTTIFVKAEKSAFHVTMVTILGFVLTPGGAKVDEDKVTAALNWPKPTTVKELQCFIGFSNYYHRFI